MYARIISFKNLLESYYRARRNKRSKRKLQKIEVNFENRLIDIKKQLEKGSYQPKPYHQFLVHEPKARQISAPALIDRIVQHAVVNIIEPVFDCQFLPNTFACRKGKGPHLCLRQVSAVYKKISRTHTVFYALKCDIKNYFASINHAILAKFLLQSISCPKTIALLKTIINSYENSPGKGIPIGNLTSQLFANIYLHPLDIFITQKLKEKSYFRYMDDFVILSFNKKYLIDLRGRIKGFLEENLKLQLHPRKSNIFRADRGLDFVGYIIKPNVTLMRKKTLRRYKKRQKKRLKRLKKYKKQLKDIRVSTQLSLLENYQKNGPKEEPLKEKIEALKTKLRTSRNSFKGFLRFSKYERLKTGGVKVNGIIIPQIFPKKK